MFYIQKCNACYCLIIWPFNSYYVLKLPCVILHILIRHDHIITIYPEDDMRARLISHRYVEKNILSTQSHKCTSVWVNLFNSQFPTLCYLYIIFLNTINYPTVIALFFFFLITIVIIHDCIKQIVHFIYSAHLCYPLFNYCKFVECRIKINSNSNLTLCTCGYWLNIVSHFR